MPLKKKVAHHSDRVNEEIARELMYIIKDVKEVATGYECGIGLERFNDIKENDILEAFIMEEIKRG